MRRADLTPVICAIEEDLRGLWQQRTSRADVRACPCGKGGACCDCLIIAREDADSIRSRVAALRILRAEQQRPAPPEDPCSECGGAGEVSDWQDCWSCDGTGAQLHCGKEIHGTEHEVPWVQGGTEIVMDLCGLEPGHAGQCKGGGS
jgi:hypothetical protein